MAEQTVVHIGENSPEQVAYKLMLRIAEVEGVNVLGHSGTPATRKWILHTFAQCAAPWQWA
jgi:hypothetical protein